MIHNLLHTLPVSLIFCTIVMGFLLMYERKKHAREAKRRENNFWQRENEANFTRRKDISQLPYIKIPYDTLPFIQNAHGEIAEYQKELLSFKDSRLLNLSGLSNTDLKLMYGVANLPELSQYDEACTAMYRTIANLGSNLAKEGYHSEAIAFLEFGLEAGSDISRNFYILADEYANAGRYDDIARLIEHARTLTSPMKASILNNLQDKYQKSLP